MKSTTYETVTCNRGTANEFILERKYLKNVTVKTLAWYGHSFKAFENCESREDYVKRIGELRERGVSAISVNTYLRCINAYLTWKGADFKLPKLKEEQKLLNTLNSEAVVKLIRANVTGTNLRRAHLVALTILSTGLRASECLSITKEDVDLDNFTIKVIGKGGRHRLVPFGIELRKLLFRHISKSTTRFVFGTKNQTKLSVRNLERDMKDLGQHCGITGVRFSPHTLRHHFAVSWLRGGGDIYMLSRVLGHSNLTITSGYLKSLGIEDIRATYNRVSILDQMHKPVR